MSVQIKVGGTILPSPTNADLTNEQIWSSGTGRSVKTGEMLGAVVAIKRTIDVEWQWIKHSEFLKIQNALSSGFFGPVVYENTEGSESITLSAAYRGNISRVDGGTINGTRYYKSVKTTIIEK